VARSTAHHHLGQLRAAGLVTMHGNARAYWFTLRADGVAAARRTLGELAAP
jgi:DNA-binding IclR family transcriptional regulator